MTMQYQNHPHDERLAALAGGDPEVAADASLHAHVAACDRCRGVVDDLTALRSALAELPDLAPSRPIQLIPPVPAPRERAGGLGLLRRLAGPVMAAGAGLAVVGAVGLAGILAGGMATSGGEAPEAGAPEPAVGGASGAEDRSLDGATASYTPQYVAPTDAPDAPESDESGRDVVTALTATDRPGPWLALLISGVALLIAGLVLRFTVQPRPG